MTTRSDGEGWPAGRQRPLFLYDGDCGFCTRSAQFIRSAVRPTVDIEPWQRMPLATLGVSAGQAGRAVWWIGAHGQRASGAAAIALVLGRSGRVGARGAAWRIAGRVLAVPPVSWVAAGVYPVVADNRHRLPGATAACAVQPGGAPGR
ncbi:thiol-disulfide oxidoreductase DCC family protein [Candidatus Frankia nodulisporulans]|uniref:thiol-disulfide oxidoreductase DCC family protein n=1 Tax=Candidatus Frankia nodulisporulans TaxID=2060052 RepID=UPI0013D815EF|nr:DUF393 domain-containing protein [Candidatus Frankia nodulisporulans]